MTPEDKLREKGMHTMWIAHLNTSSMGRHFSSVVEWVPSYPTHQTELRQVVYESVEPLDAFSSLDLLWIGLQSFVCDQVSKER